MAKIFKARFSKGCIEPREPVEFPEGAELVVSAEEIGASATETGDEGFEAALNAFRSTIGALRDIDVEARIAALYRAREEGTRPFKQA